MDLAPASHPNFRVALVRPCWCGNLRDSIALGRPGDATGITVVDRSRNSRSWPVLSEKPNNVLELDLSYRLCVVPQLASVLKPRYHVRWRRLLCVCTFGVHRRQSELYERVRSAAIALYSYT